MDRLLPVKPETQAIQPSEVVKILTEILNARQKKNSSYSKTALAKDMGISQSLLSMILGGKRPLTIAQAKKSSILLRLSDHQERTLIEASICASDNSSRVRARLEEQERIREANRARSLEFDHFYSIAKWFHMPILALVTTKDFKNKPAWIARKLGISIDEAREAVSRLIRLGLLVEEGKILKLVNQRNELTAKKSEAAIREHHVQMMKRAEETMFANTDDASWMVREISSLSLAIDPDKVPEAKALVKKFKEELTRLMTEGEIRKVYQLNVQLFPLTKD